MNIKKILRGSLALATIYVAGGFISVCYKYTFNPELQLKNELKDYYSAVFFCEHSRILYSNTGKSHNYAIKQNRIAMEQDGYTNHEIRMIELDAENAAIKEWLKTIINHE